MQVLLQTPVLEQQAQKFYQLILQEDLLGGWTLIRQWGFLGSRGSSKQQYYVNADDAQKALCEYRDKQLRLGFRVVFAQGN